MAGEEHGRETRDGKDDRYPWLIIADLPYSQGDDISGKHQDRSAFFSETGQSTELLKLGQPRNSHIRKVIAVMSGKGGVGKSSVAALLASGWLSGSFSRPVGR